MADKDSHVFFVSCRFCESFGKQKQRMMKKVSIGLLAILSIILSSCATTLPTSLQTTETKVDYMESSARVLEPTQSIMTTTLIADLKVIGNRITYTETKAFEKYEVTEGLISFVPSFKKIALCNAARANDADIIIGALVDVITNDKGRFEITISGYPARYTNFRNATEKDMELVKQGLAIAFNNNESALDNPQETAAHREIKTEQR